MKKYLPIIKKCALFSNIRETDLLTMLGCLNAKIQHFQKNQEIFSEGSAAEWIGILLSGQAQITQIDYYGNRHIIANIEVSQLFGESFACAGIPSLPIAVTATCDTDVMMISCKKITQTCNNACAFHNQIVLNLLNVIARKNLFFNQKLEIISKRSTREKLTAYLLSEAKQHRNDSFSIPYSRQELADFLGVDRSGLSSEIGKLCKEGLIETNRKWFRIHDHLND